MRLPFKKTPCNNCPFRKDCLKGWLGGERMEEILKEDSFICHKTAYGADKEKRQCAGHIHIKKESNVFYRVARAMGFDMSIGKTEKLFENEKDLIKHHKR